MHTAPSLSPNCMANRSTIPARKTTKLKVKGKVKVKFALEQAMKTYRGKKRYSSTLSLTSALYGGGWLKSRPGRFIPGKETR